MKHGYLQYNMLLITSLVMTELMIAKHVRSSPISPMQQDELTESQSRILNQIISNVVYRTNANIIWKSEDIGGYKAAPLLAKAALGQRNNFTKKQLLLPIPGLIRNSKLSEWESNELRSALCEILSQSAECVEEIGSIIQYFPDPSVIDAVLIHIETASMSARYTPLRYGLYYGANEDHARKLLIALVMTKSDEARKFIVDVIGHLNVIPVIDIYRIITEEKGEILRHISHEAYMNLLGHVRNMHELSVLYFDLNSDVKDVRSQSFRELKRRGIDFSFNTDIGIGQQPGKADEVEELLKALFVSKFPTVSRAVAPERE